ATRRRSPIRASSTTSSTIGRTAGPRRRNSRHRCAARWTCLGARPVPAFGGGKSRQTVAFRAHLTIIYCCTDQHLASARRFSLNLRCQQVSAAAIRAGRYIATSSIRTRCDAASNVRGRGAAMISIQFASLAGAAALGVILSAAGPSYAREIVAFRDNSAAGSIIIRTGERRLYYVMGDGRAVRYPVGVGKAGKQ